MPEPDWIKTADSWDEWGPQKHRDILGEDRRSKTFYTDTHMAFVMTKAQTKRRAIIEALRTAHANHYEVPVFEEDEETGESVFLKYVPEVLTDNQVIERYRGARLWDEICQGFRQDLVSTDGFSIKAVSGFEEAERQRDQPESSTRSHGASKDSGKSNTRMQ